MHPNLAARKKPELPKHLELFRILYSTLDTIPAGPPYVGNFTFQVDKLTFKEVEYIKEMRSKYKPTAMTFHLASEFGLFVRAESLAGHYYKDEKILWQKTRSEYIKAFEKCNNVATKRRKGVAAKIFYKPFIIWCIENGYEFYQVGRVLGWVPGTVRKYANEWGYKEHTLVRSKQPDLHGKESRTEVLKENEQGDLFNNTIEALGHIPERHELKLPKEVQDKAERKRIEELTGMNIIDGNAIEDFKVYERRKQEEIQSYGSLLQQAFAAGHKVTITIEPK